MYCRGQLVQLQRDLPLFERAGFGLAAISYDSSAVLHEFAARKSITFPLLADHDSKVIRAFGVANHRYPAGSLIDIETEQVTNNPGDIPVYGVAYPSVFVLAPNGTVRWRFVSETDELRLTGASILARSVGLSPETNRQTAPAARVHIAIAAASSEIGLGNRVHITVEVQLPAGLHLYAPNAGGSYHGLNWTMESSDCWYQTDPQYPASQPRQFAFEERPVPVYEGLARVTREIVLKPVLSAADPSLYRLFRKVCVDPSFQVKASGTVAFQVCSDRECYPPQSVPIAWKFRFVPPDLQRSPPELRREFEQ